MNHTTKIFIVTVCGFILVGCGRTRTIIQEFPDGFEGWVFIIYGADGFPPLPKDHGNEVLNIPADGILITSTPQYTGWAHVQNYYVDASGKRVKELVNQNAQGGASGPLDNEGSGATIYYTYVGPLGALQSQADYAAKGSEARRRVKMHHQTTIGQ